MKKTKFVWFMLVIVVLGTIIGIATFAAEYTGLITVSYTGYPELEIIGTILNIVSYVISIIYVLKLNKMTRDSIKWTNFTFTSYVAVLLFSTIGIAINTGNLLAGIIMNVPMLIIEIVLWILFYKHLKKVMSINV